MDECPSISWTILGCTPLLRSKVAHVCLRSWNLLLGRFAFSRRGFQERFIRLWQLMGVPDLVEKTHSHPFCLFLCSRTLRRATLESLMPLLLFLVFGGRNYPAEDGPVYHESAFG